MARIPRPTRTAAAKSSIIRAFPVLAARSGAEPATSGRGAVRKSVLPSSVYRLLDPVQRYGVRLTLVAVVVVLIAAPFSFLLFQVLSDGPLTRFDEDLANRMNRLVAGHDGWIAVFDVVSLLGKPVTLWVVTGISVLYTWRHNAPRLTLFLLATTDRKSTR